MDMDIVNTTDPWDDVGLVQKDLDAVEFALKQALENQSLDQSEIERLTQRRNELSRKVRAMLGIFG